MADNGLSPMQELVAAISAGITMILTAVGAVFYGKRSQQAPSDSSGSAAPVEDRLVHVMGPLLDRVTTLEVKQQNMKDDLVEIKAEYRELRGVINEMNLKLSEIHGMLSNRERDHE